MGRRKTTEGQLFPDFMKGYPAATPRPGSRVRGTRRVTKHARWRAGLSSVPWPDPTNTPQHVFRAWYEMRNALDVGWDTVKTKPRQAEWWYRAFTLWLLKEAVWGHLKQCEQCSEADWDFVTSQIYDTPEGAEFNPQGGADE